MLFRRSIGFLRHLPVPLFPDLGKGETETLPAVSIAGDLLTKMQLKCILFESCLIANIVIIRGRAAGRPTLEMTGVKDLADGVVVACAAEFPDFALDANISLLI